MYCCFLPQSASSNASRFHSNARFLVLLVFSLSVLAACAQPVVAPEPKTKTTYQQFTNFETEPVRPLVISESQQWLYALNTFDDRLEVFRLDDERPQSIGETLVGLRPVALVERARGELWVVNHLSDAVSVVDVRNPAQPHVIRTLPVGDEPRGIVAAGPDRRWVMVACANRGQELTPGKGRADIWVFDAQSPEAAPKRITLFGMKPRALAVSPDGRYVYASIFHSGNGTTVTSGESAVQLGRASAHGPYSFGRYKAKPKAGAIVAYQDGQWLDLVGRDWSEAIPFELPDTDVFVIDTRGDAPKVVSTVSGVGTTLFDLAVHPHSGEVWVANTEAGNLVPLEPQLQSRFAVNRISRLLPESNHQWRVETKDLNPHIDRALPRSTAAKRQLSLAQPTSLLFRPDGHEAYVAAFGSAKVAVLDANAEVKQRIPVGFGPAGLAHDAKRQRLYVLNYLDASISVVDLTDFNTTTTVELRHNPTPKAIQAGRPLLYDATLTSGHGDLSCATCHVFGDLDGLAWDLGDPEGELEAIPTALKHPEADMEPRQLFHPAKGPMMTQSLRGLAHTAPFHWRGDRFGSEHQPGRDIPSFMTFNGTYVNLLGRSQEFPDDVMKQFAHFAMTIHYPPNPNQRLDRSLSAAAQAGFDFYNGPFKSDRGVQTCADCHTLPTGTNRRINFEGYQVGRDMKSAQLRNVYQKVGRFNTEGPQVSGFGLLHDGSMDTIVNFLTLDVFTFPGETEEEKNEMRRKLHHYMMAFDTGMAPAVGHQLTLNAAPSTKQRDRLSLLMDRAALGDCDLLAYGQSEGRQQSWLWQKGRFQPDQVGHALSLDALVQNFHRQQQPITFLCVPPGDGYRTALDRDLDGRLNGDDPHLDNPQSIATAQ